jgi:hypothetical protein
MTEADRIPDDAWRLDDDESIERQPRPAPPPTTTGIAVNLSDQRLARAVYVVTAEHLGWYVVAAYALVTRVIALGARPLDSAQATGALASSVIAAHGRVAFALADASWVAMLQGWIFAAAGATDASSRIVAMLCSLTLVAVGFAMRPVLGRAGGLAFAALIAISPSVTYFSRGGSAAIVSIAFMMIAIAIAESMRRRPGVLRAAGLGVAIALWLSADPIGYVTATAMVVSLLLVGVADAMRIDHRRLRIRVWWNRRRLLVIVCAIVAIGAWLSLTTAFFHRPLVPAVQYSFSAAFAPPSIAFRHALHRLIPILAFYEFIIVILAIVGGGDDCRARGIGSESFRRGRRSYFAAGCRRCMRSGMDASVGAVELDSLCACGGGRAHYLCSARGQLRVSGARRERGGVAPARVAVLGRAGDVDSDGQGMRARAECRFACERECDGPRRCAAGAMVSARFCADRVARHGEHRRDCRQDSKRRARGKP